MVLRSKRKVNLVYDEKKREESFDATISFRFEYLGFEIFFITNIHI